jgi:hypothetical protein
LRLYKSKIIEKKFKLYIELYKNSVYNNILEYTSNLIWKKFKNWLIASIKFLNKHKNYIYVNCKKFFIQL